MELSPDEIERRSFAIEDRGYDRDEVREYLVEIAASLRSRRAAAAEPGATVPRLDPDQFTHLGSEVAAVLRAAHDAVDVLHAQADRDIAARSEEAEARSDEVRRQAEVAAARTHDQAKRLLITAQEQADAIVLEAQAKATSMIETARRHAEDHVEQVNSRSRRHADQILRAEHEALRRLHQAQAGLAAAVEMLTGSETRPVVDLTELRPNVRLGSLEVEIGDAGERRDRSADDPVTSMVRSAVDRAAAHAQDAARRPDPAQGDPEVAGAARPGAGDPGGLVAGPGRVRPVTVGVASPPGPAQPVVGATTAATTETEPSGGATH